MYIDNLECIYLIPYCMCFTIRTLPEPLPDCNSCRLFLRTFSKAFCRDWTARCSSLIDACCKTCTLSFALLSFCEAFCRRSFWSWISLSSRLRDFVWELAIPEMRNSQKNREAVYCTLSRKTSVNTALDTSWLVWCRNTCLLSSLGENDWLQVSTYLISLQLPKIVISTL